MSEQQTQSGGVPEEYERISRMLRPFEAQLMAKSNVVGVGAGNKFVGGEDTGSPCVVVLVTSKQPVRALNEDDVVPENIEDIPTDVWETGVILPSFSRRIRPAPGGISISRTTGFNGTGTLGTGCFDEEDIEDDDIPRRYYLLSCNHVLANLNQGVVGDQIISPGLSDGGSATSDGIANLRRWVPIQWATVNPDGSLTGTANFVDAAIAQCDLDDVNREIHWIGYPRRFPPGQHFRTWGPGMRLQKTGRTTDLSFGVIRAVNLVIALPYPNGNFAFFRDVIMTTKMTEPGDSGAIACEIDNNVAIGMAFASSISASFLNEIRNVENRLKVRIAPDPV